MELQLRLERALPPSLPIGSTAVVWLTGLCWHPQQRLAGLELVADGHATPADGYAMPRPDAVAADPVVPLASGFWGMITLHARGSPGRLSVGVRARLPDGSLLSAPVGEVQVVSPQHSEPLPVRPQTGERARIAVAMATYEPDPELLAAQLESLRAQSDTSWVCVISDDCSSPARLAEIRRAVAGDGRFHVSASPRRLGFYRNFERGLSLAARTAELVALCDQDDRWHPDKLVTLVDALGDAGLAYSDLRLVDAAGNLIRDTLWSGRANNPDNLTSMLVANSVTGAAMLLRREVAELALPFPDGPGFQFHDHWLALVGLAGGRLAYVDRPLYDYVQHPGAVFGDVTHGRPPPRRRVRLRGMAERWRAAYFLGYVPRAIQARTLLARCEPRLSERQRRGLQWYLAAGHSMPALIWLALRPLRFLGGRTETLGSEYELLCGLLWRRLARVLGDTAIPPPLAFSQRRLRRWRADLKPRSRRRRYTR